MTSNLSERDLLNVSTRCKSFVELTPDVVRLIFEHCTERRFDPGALMMRQGDKGDCLMVLLEGSAKVSAHGFKGDPRIATLHEFDVLGEMALLTGQERTVDVLADSQVRALVLDVDEFQKVATQHPEVAMVLTHLMADRLGESSMDALGGKFIDRYRVLRCAGRGSMAVVYKASDGDDADPVALKMMSHRLLYEKGAMARFQREADLLKILHHDNIARVDRQFTAYRTSFIAMEYCDGPDLGTLLGRGKGFDEETVKRMVSQVGEALRYMHSKGIIHRDLKPSNVMSTLGGRIKLTDFGLAKPTGLEHSPGITQTNSSLMGTPLYMAPEQLSGAEASRASDIYSLGCMTYELLTGRTLFAGNNFFELCQDKLSFRLPDPADIGAGVSAEMHEFLARCLAHGRDERSIDYEQLASWSGPIRPEVLN